jgi:phospholipase C
MASLDHIIVLMMENNSFDRMLGALLSERSDGGGIKGTAANHWNDDGSATPLPPVRHVMQTTTTHIVQPDPSHELPDVLKQIAGPNLGYVTDYATVYPTGGSTPSTWLQRQEIMDYYDDGVLPILHTLAKQYTICDRWFSSLPGPTWPNRVFVHTGTSLGYTTNSVGNNWDQTTIYELLDNNNISWKIYCGDGDISQTAVLRHTPWVDSMRNFFPAAQAPAASFPQYCFIEPNYGTLHKASENDQHPLSDVFRGELLIRDVYNALRANDALWQSSLLIINYDEHGGFYDHVAPPPAVPPDNRTDGTGFKFDKLGVRVPSVLVSPWLDQGVISDTFDHTSILKFLVQKWGLANLLGDRVAAPSTNTFANYLRKSPRSTYGLLPTTTIPSLIAMPDNLPLSDNQRDLIELGHHLALQISDPSIRNGLTTRPIDPTPMVEGRLAVEQFQSFLSDRVKQRPASLANISGPSMTKPRKAKVRKTKRGKKRRSKK